MGISVTGEEGETMGGALAHRQLERIVIGKVKIPSRDDLGEVRKFAAVGPNFRRGVWVAVAVGWRACQASTNRTCVPSGANCRLVNVGLASLLKTVVTDVGDVHGQVVRDGALDIQIPGSDIRFPEVRVHPSGGARPGPVG